MQKTKLGISVGLLGAGVFFTCFFGGYMAALLIVGYVLLFEENAWLKQSAVKAITLMVAFSLLSAVIYLIPNLISVIDSLAGIFNGYFHIKLITNLVDLISNGLNLLEKVLFILLGLKALTQGTVKIPVIDSLLDKYMA